MKWLYIVKQTLEQLMYVLHRGFRTDGVLRGQQTSTTSAPPTHGQIFRCPFSLLPKLGRHISAVPPEAGESRRHRIQPRAIAAYHRPVAKRPQRPQQAVLAASSGTRPVSERRSRPHRDVADSGRDGLRAADRLGRSHLV